MQLATARAFRGAQQAPTAVPNLQMWQLHAMVWQQQPSKAVVQRLAGTEARPICPAAQEVLLQVLNSAICQAGPPSTQYIARLVKQLITAAEEQQQELSEPLLELHTALLMLGSSAAAMQEDAGWRYKTFYYSSSPSWRELQQLQAQQCRCIAAAVKNATSSSNPAEPTNAPAKSAAEWTMPVQFQQRLTQRQRFMTQLLSAVQLHCCQQPGDTEAAGCSSGQQITVEAAYSGSSSSSSSSGLITVHSSDNMFEGGTGCHMWDAGFLLAEFVLNNPRIFAGKRVLEVGCGPGLVATCLCRSGAGRVLLTDGDPQTLVNCLTNLRMNGHADGTLLSSWWEAAGFVQGQELCGDNGHMLQHQVQACPLDWHEDVPGLCADVIVGSDICYDPDAVPSLVRLLRQLLLSGTAPQHELDSGSAQHELDSGSAQQGPESGSAQQCGQQTAPAGAPPVAYISTTKRQGSTLQLFLDTCGAAGLRVEEVPKQPEAWGRAAAGVGGGGDLTPAVFQELPALEDGEGRGRYVLHRVTRATSCCCGI